MKIDIKRIVVSLSLSVLLFMGCEEVLDDNLVSPEDSTTAALLATEANASLLVLMDALLAANPDSAGLILNLLDFTNVNDLYAQSFDLDYRNREVNFGLAFTSVMRLSQHSNLNDLLGSNFRVFQPLNAPTNQVSTVGYGYGLPLSTKKVKGMISQYYETPVAIASLKYENLQAFNDFQAEIRDVFIPMIEAGLAALDSLANDSDFTFNVGEDIQVDYVDAMALKASLYGLQAIYNTISAYEFELTSLDSAGIVDGLSIGSPFGTLSNSGMGMLSDAQESVLNSLNQVIAVLDLLEADTLAHSHVLSQYGATNLNQSRGDLGAIFNVLGSPTSFQYGYENADGEFSVAGAMQIDISQFYANPVTDLKTVLPAYTVTTTTAYHYQTVSLQEDVHLDEAEVVVAGMNNTSVIINIEYSESNGDTVATVKLGFFTFNLLTANQNEIPAAIWELWDVFLGIVDTYSDELYNFPEISFHWSGVITTGQSLVIDGPVAIEYQERLGSYVAPYLMWNATSYEAWLLDWQNPTVNGMFPNFSAANLSNLLGITWE